MNDKIPATEAGRAMLRRFGTYTDLDGWPIANRILAIEAEASHPGVSAALRRALARLRNLIH